MVGAVKDTHLSLEVLASTVGVALLETHVFSSSVAAKKLHRANSSRFNALRVCLSWVKCSGTHQEDKNLAWWKNTLEPTVYLYDGPLDQGWNVIEEVDNSGNVLARYTQRQEMDQTLAELRSGATSYFEQDGIGSVTSLSNSAAALANTYSYDSFGNLTGSTGTITNPFRYTAREFDPETNIYEYRARYFDPSIGRFIGEDPMGFEAGTNFYRYVENRPLDLVDPLGLSTLVFHRESGLLYIYDGFGNFLGVCEAHNNTATGSRGPWPNGFYGFLYHKYHPPDPNGPYGSYGIFVFNRPPCEGCGVHSGRANHPDKRGRVGTEAATEGCIRTTDSCMRFITGINIMDPITNIIVY